MHSNVATDDFSVHLFTPTTTPSNFWIRHLSSRNVEQMFETKNKTAPTTFRSKSRHRLLFVQTVVYYLTATMFFLFTFPRTEENSHRKPLLNVYFYMFIFHHLWTRAFRLSVCPSDLFSYYNYCCHWNLLHFRIQKTMEQLQL